MLLDSFDSLWLDLDGVVYRGNQAVPEAIASISRAQITHKIGYITNNSSRTPAAIAEQLRGYGLELSESQIVGSARAGAQMLLERIPHGSKVLVVGGEGLRFECQEVGFEVVDSASENPAAVIQGFSPDVSWRELAQASFAVQAGAIWIATNQDWTIPLEAGIAPGNGTLVGAVHTAVGMLPDFAGKPFQPIFRQAFEQLGVKAPLMIGDRLDTDIRGAKKVGVKSATVLTGIATRKEIIGAKPDDRPDFILQNLSDLFHPYPKLKQTKRGVSCGDALVEKLSNKVILVDGDPYSIDALRAATSLVWNCGTPIYGLEIEPALYSEGLL